MRRKGAVGRKPAREEMEMIGIDVGKATLSVTCVDPGDLRVRWEMTVPNSPEGIAQIRARPPVATPWVVEPTGRYSRLVVEEGTKHHHVVLMAPPKQAKAFLRALSPRAKTDRLDSYGLARYGLAVPLREYPRAAAVVEHVGQLQSARRGLVNARMRLRQQAVALPAAAPFLAAAIAGLDTEIAALDAALAQADLPHRARLQAVPGIGPVTATAVAASLASRDFSSSDAFVAYVGLDPRVNDSGTHQGKRTLSKQGPGELRRLLYLAAQANLRMQGSPFHQQYERERAKGLATTAALNAVARKLARLCWSLVQHEATYEPERAYRQRVPIQRGPGVEAGQTRTRSGGGPVGNAEAQPESAGAAHVVTTPPHDPETRLDGKP